MAQRNAYRGKVAIITGGASGIGAALAKEIARLGAQVVVADRQVELAQSVTAAIVEAQGIAVAAEVDVRDANALKQVVEQTVARWGAVHYFFNNAGIGVGGEVANYLQRDWDDTFDVNLRGVAYGISAVYPQMIRQGEGHIVNTASVAGLFPAPAQVAYSATKFAVFSISNALRIEAARYGVRVSVLCPGAIRTPILVGGKYGRTNTQGVSEETMRKTWDRLRPIEPEVFAKKALEGVARDEAVIIVPGWWRVVWAIQRLSPALGARLMSRGFERLRLELERAGARPAHGDPEPSQSVSSSAASSQTPRV